MIKLAKKLSTHKSLESSREKKITHIHMMISGTVLKKSIQKYHRM